MDFDVSVAPLTKTQRRRMRLKTDAVPTVFSNGVAEASQATKERPTMLATPSARRFSQEQVSPKVCYSSQGLAGLTKNLLEKHGDKMSYVLLGKIRSDNIERHFGNLCKLSGGNHSSSVRQFMENEAVIRTKSLIW